MPEISAGTPARQTGTSAPSRAANACQANGAGALGVGAPHGPQQRRGVGRSAAEPGRNRQVLLELDGAQLQPCVVLAQKGQRRLQQVGAVDVAGERTGGRHAALGPGVKHDPIADRGEGHQALDLVIAVRAPAEHAQA